MNILWIVTLPHVFNMTYGTAGNETDALLKNVTAKVNENEAGYVREMERTSSLNPKLNFDSKNGKQLRIIPDYANTFAVPVNDKFSNGTIDNGSDPPSSIKENDEMKQNRCVQCNVSFRYDNRYAEHCKVVHGIKRPFSCGYCERKFSTKHYLTDHLDEVHGFKNHPYAYWKKNEPIACHECQETLHGWMKFEMHALYKHNGKKMMACSHCPKKYLRRRQLLRHERLEHRNLEVKCGICKNIFERSDLLREHLEFCEQRQIHNKMGDKQLDTIIRFEMLVCEECGDEYKTFTLLKDHHRLKHPHVKLHACDRCDAAFSYNGTLEKHVDMAHPDKTGEMKTGKKFKRGAIYECEYCKENFTGTVEYEKHGKRHPGKPMFRCKDCGKGYGTRKSLSNHANEVHGDVKKRCCHCSRCYFRLYNHEKGCKEKMEKRERKRMAGYPKHYCGVCSQDFYMTNNSFKSHVNRHKYYECCSICGQRFLRGGGALKNHMERKHPLSQNIEVLVRTADQVRTIMKREKTADVPYTNTGTEGFGLRNDSFGHEVKAEVSGICVKLEEIN